MMLILISMYFSSTFSLFFLDECGIVAQISQPLADSDISAYYISTFSFDHALVSSASSCHQVPTVEVMENLSVGTFVTQIMITLSSDISRLQIWFLFIQVGDIDR